MPMQMAMGGSVPRNTQIAGQPHAIIVHYAGEAGVLRAMGGAGRQGEAVFRHFSLILMGRHHWSRRNDPDNQSFTLVALMM